MNFGVLSYFGCYGLLVYTRYYDIGMEFRHSTLFEAGARIILSNACLFEAFAAACVYDTSWLRSFCFTIATRSSSLSPSLPRRKQALATLMVLSLFFIP